MVEHLQTSFPKFFAVDRAIIQPTFENSRSLGEKRRADRLGLTKLKTNARAPPNDPIIDPSPTRPRFTLFLKVNSGYCKFFWMCSKDFDETVV